MTTASLALDSLPPSAGGKRRDALDAVRAFLQAEHQERQGEFSTPVPFEWAAWRTASLGARTPKQTDSCSCGIFALLGMRALARRVPLHAVQLPSHICTAPSYWRRRFALWLSVGHIL